MCAHAEPSETLFGQLQRQTCGWKESLERIRDAVQHRGAYDGLLGFSQGCAMALLLLAASELAQSSPSSGPDGADAGSWASSRTRVDPGECGVAEPQQSRGPASDDSNTKHGCCSSKASLELHNKGLSVLSEELQQEIRSFAQPNASPYKFAFLFSGHRGVCPEAQQIIRAAAPLATPSMHVYGAPGQDQQVPYAASAELTGLFDNARAVVHSKGHVAPSSKADCQLYLEFVAAAVQGVVRSEAEAGC